MTTPTKIRFNEVGPFRTALNARVNALLDQPGVMEWGYRKLHRKAVIITAWVIGSYLCLLLLPHGPMQIVLCGASLMAAMVALQFNVMHDGNHNAFSKRPWLNRLAGWSLEIVGGYSQHWQGKHNVTHHGYTNIDGWDHDIDQPPFARLTRTQEWREWYRWQHLYLWPLYGMMLFRWLTLGDFFTAITGRILNFKLKRSWRQTMPRLVPTKLLAWGWQLALPLYLNWSWHKAIVVVVVYICLMWTLSCFIVVVFQLAHCVDETQFLSPADADENGLMPEEWMIGQVKATADFCPNNRFIRWFTGGLNYQIEHHLFASKPHTLYPAIAKIVQQVCAEYGVTYVCHSTFWSALAAHQRHLRNMGQPTQKAAASA